MQNTRLVRFITVVLGAMLALSAAAPAWSAPMPVLAQVSAPVAQNQNFVAGAVDAVGAAVVRIDTERTVTRRYSNPLFEDPFFRPFFGEQTAPNPSFEQRLRGQGSGFIIDSNGLILTNAHVVDRADRVSVRLKDGRTFNGEVLGADEVTDLAVVRIVGNSDLPVATLGDSDQVNVGDWAIAVGNPLGLDNTVTLGIVSTLNRSSSAVGIPDKRLEFIQTDAAINPGNSGGPLLNDRGAVIGVNTAIRANANGIGFAIPINKVKEITPQLARGEQVDHPYIGVQIATLTPRIAQDNNSDPNSTVMLPEVNGVLVTGIQPGTPAASSGLRRGDVIVSVNDQAVTSAADLQTLVDDSRVGQNLQLQVRRGSESIRLSVRTANLERT
ncbi:MAG: HhoA/HhoB/HtrA family serine endopeptidase [Elainellaceae cyanobacterium]